MCIHIYIYFSFRSSFSPIVDFTVSRGCPTFKLVKNVPSRAKFRLIFSISKQMFFASFRTFESYDYSFCHACRGVPRGGGILFENPRQILTKISLIIIRLCHKPDVTIFLRVLSALLLFPWHSEREERERSKFSFDWQKLPVKFLSWQTRGFDFSPFAERWAKTEEDAMGVGRKGEGGESAYLVEWCRDGWRGAKAWQEICWSNSSM